VSVGGFVRTGNRVADGVEVLVEAGVGGRVKFAEEAARAVSA
jgi:hypothetical protein